jgi:hypothetical protein
MTRSVDLILRNNHSSGTVATFTIWPDMRRSGLAQRLAVSPLAKRLNPPSNSTAYYARPRGVCVCVREKRKNGPPLRRSLSLAPIAESSANCRRCMHEPVGCCRRVLTHICTIKEQMIPSDPSLCRTAAWQKKSNRDIGRFGDARRELRRVRPLRKDGGVQTGGLWLDPTFDGVRRISKLLAVAAPRPLSKHVTSMTRRRSTTDVLVMALVAF